MATQQFNESELDYSVLEKHKTWLTLLSRISNSGITVFDMYKQQHVYTSYNFADLFGYDLEAIEKIGNEYFNARIHPDDIKILTYNGLRIFKHFQYRMQDLRDCKLINEYRIRGSDDKYVRVIEQFRVLEFDKRNNVWLSLSILDLSPDQNTYQGVICKIFNCKTGEYYSPEDIFDLPEKKSLSTREIEVLQMVKNGFLSKEISERLSISIHTVNTHRQKILEKLNTLHLSFEPAKP